MEFPQFGTFHLANGTELSEQGVTMKRKEVEKIKKMAQKVINSIDVNKEYPSYKLQRYTDSVESFESRLRNIEIDKAKALRAVEEDFAERIIKYQEHITLSKKRLEEEKKHLSLTKADARMLRAYQTAVTDFEKLYGRCPVRLPDFDAPVASLQVIVESEKLPIVEVKGVGEIPLTKAEMTEMHSLAQMRRDAEREIKEREIKEEEYAQEMRERAEKERRMAEEADRKRQDARRQAELKGEVFSLYHPEDMAPIQSQGEPALPAPNKTKSGRKVIIKTPSCSSSETSSVTSETNSWTSQDERELQQRLAEEKQKREARRAWEAQKFQEAYEARRQQLEAEGDEQVTFADFLHNGSFRDAPSGAVASLAPKANLPPITKPVVKNEKRQVKKVGMNASSYSLPLDD